MAKHSVMEIPISRCCWIQRGDGYAEDSPLAMEEWFSPFHEGDATYPYNLVKDESHGR